MIDISKEIKTALSTVLPTYYELFCDASVAKPCITYLPLDNYDDAVGNVTGFSRLRYTIKLWCDDLNNAIPYCLNIDAKMRSLGFSRTSANDLVYDNHICKIFTYSALGIEKFN